MPVISKEQAQRASIHDPQALRAQTQSVHETYPSTGRAADPESALFRARAQLENLLGILTDCLTSGGTDF
jgi:D-serine deaminase-like pyridoxal phosphate-dependent protein